MQMLLVDFVFNFLFIGGGERGVQILNIFDHHFVCN